jgi:hypothetical protein
MKKNTTLFILILSCIFAIIILSLYLFNGILYNVYTKSIETFENQDSNIVVNSCPSFLKQFSDANGDVLCCKGDINGRKCSGDIVCAVSATSTSIPSCKVYRTKYLDEQSTKFCPSSMPNYYENTQSGVKGCTYGGVNATGEAPATISQKTCIVYSNNENTLHNETSCLTQKSLEKMYVPTTVTDRKLINVGNNLSLPLATYLDDMKMPRQCTNKDSMIKYYNYLIKVAKTNEEKVRLEKVLNDMINKHIFVCENAQKVFIDKSLSKSDALFL